MAKKHGKRTGAPMMGKPVCAKAVFGGRKQASKTGRQVFG